jgi:sec-independent protein translocase protein TatB
MLNLDPGKLLIIAVVAVILLGPDKLPQVARQLGGAWRSFSEFRHRMETEVRSSIPDLPSSSDIARLARSPSALLTHLSNMGPAEDAPDAGMDAQADSPPPPPTSAPAPTPARPTEVIDPGDPSLN